MDNKYRIVLTDSPDPADVQVIRERLDAYDAAQGAPVDWVPLALFVRDQHGTIVGGLTTFQHGDGNVSVEQPRQTTRGDI